MSHTLSRKSCITSTLLATLLISSTLFAGELKLLDLSKGTNDFALNEGHEFPGAKGELKVQTDNQVKALVLAADFSKGGQYVSAMKGISTSYPLTELQVSYKTSTVKALMVRMTDATGQVHQSSLPLEADGQQHVLNVPSYGTTKAQTCWGGAKDRKWHEPITGLGLLIEKHQIKSADKKGNIDFLSVTAILSDKKIIPEFKETQQALGNIFAQGEQVCLAFETKYPEAQYYIQDFSGKIVQLGRLKVEDNAVNFQPNVTATGHYSLFVTPLAKNEIASTHQVDFAIVPTPLDPAAKINHFGTATHFAQGWSPEVIPLIRKAGITDVRDELYWGGVEKQPGEYSFDKYQPYMDELKKNDITPLIILSFENKLYDKGLTPHTDAGRKAYSNYANAILDHFGDQIKALDVWNEYNGSWCKGPAAKDRGKYYTDMIKQVHTDVKAKHPEITILGGAAVLAPIPYFKRIFETGGLDYMDEIVIHPYRGTPEGVDKDIAELQALAKEYCPDKTFPMVATEYGCFAMDKPKVQTSYMVRIATLMLSTGMHRMYWYLFMDHANFVGMGLLHSAKDSRGKYTPSPAYVSMAVMNQQLADAEFEKRLSFEKYSPVRAYRFQTPRGPLHVLWSPEPASVRVKFDGELHRTDLMGNTTAIAATPEGIVLDLDQTPFYLQGKVDSITELPSEEIVIAGSVNDYSKRQGEKGWFYGYLPIPGDSNSFTELKQVTNMWGDRWGGVTQYMNVTGGGMHPGLKGKQPLWAVRRWKSDITGGVNIKGVFKRGPKGDGSTGVILIDGIKVFEKNIGGKDYPAEQTFDLIVDVKPGTMVDFAVTPGPKNILLYDGVGFRAKISAQRSVLENATRKPE